MIFHSHVSLPEGTKHGNHQHLMACSGTPRHPTSGGSGSTTVYCSCRFRGNTDTVEILEKETTRLQVVLGKVDSNWCSLKGKSNIPTILLGIQSDWCWWTRPEINGTADIVHKIAHTRNEVLSGIFVCTYTTVNPQNKIRNMGVYYNIRIPYIYIYHIVSYPIYPHIYIYYILYINHIHYIYNSYCIQYIQNVVIIPTSFFHMASRGYITIGPGWRVSPEHREAKQGSFNSYELMI